MSLLEKTRHILENFDSEPSEQIIAVLEQIKLKMHSPLTREYLDGKINEIRDMPQQDDEAAKKKLCKKLEPYLDWYIQGN